MTRALFFGLFVLLSATVFAVPTAEQEQISIGSIISALGIDFVCMININITVSMIHPKNHIDCCLTTDLRQLDSLNTNLVTCVCLFAVDLVAHSCEFSAGVTCKSCLADAIYLLKEREIPVSNPLPLELTIKSISSSAGLNGTEVATFDHTFSSPGLVIGPLASRNSGPIPNVLVTQGVENSLGIVPFGVLDLSNTNARVQ